MLVSVCVCDFLGSVKRDDFLLSAWLVSCQQVGGCEMVAAALQPASRLLIGRQTGESRYAARQSRTVQGDTSW